MSTSSVKAIQSDGVSIEIKEELGSGGHGDVYIGRAGEGGATYAVKFLRNATSEAKKRFYSEAAYLASFDNKAFPHVFHVSPDSVEHPYLVEELVQGVPLKKLIVDSAFSALGAASLQSFRTLWASLLPAINELHRRGSVHRDIKPENIIVDSEGRGKLLDFGTVCRTGRVSSPGEFAGSITYASPEQAGTLSIPVDHRSDLYSIGVVMYEMLVGRPPYVHSDPSECLRLHASAPIPRVRESSPECPQAIDEIVFRLMRKDPLDRPGSCLELLRRLENLDQTEIVGDVANDLRRTIPLFGREKELIALREIAEECRINKAGSLFVEGASGSGKTRIVTEFLTQVIPGFQVFTGKFERTQNPTPLGPLRSLADQLAVLLQKQPELLKGIAPHTAVLSAISPALLQISGSGILPDYSSPESFQDALIDSLIEISKCFPFTVFLDDLQWMDVSSHALLARLAKRKSAGAIVWVSAARSDSEHVAKLKSLQEQIPFLFEHTLVLNPLDRNGTGALTRFLLGNRECATELLDQISSRAGGNPYSIIEYTALMLDEGILRPSWKQWTFNPTILNSVSLPKDLLEILLERVKQVGAGTLRTLQKAALLGGTFDQTVLAESASDPAVLHLAGGVQQNLIEQSAQAGSFQFIHDKVREAILASIAPQELAAIHFEIAERLKSLPRDKYLCALANHSFSSGTLSNQKEVFGYLVAAGMQSFADHHIEESNAFLLNAQSMGQAVGVALPVDALVVLGKTSFMMKDDVRAMTFFRAALDQTQNLGERLEIRTSIASVLHVRRATEAAWQECLVGLREAKFPVSMNEPGSVLLFLREFLVFFVRRIIAPKKVLTDPDQVRERKALIHLILTMAQLSSFTDRAVHMVTLGFRVYPLSHALGPSRELAVGNATVGMWLNTLGISGPGRGFFSKAAAMSEQLSDPYARIEVRFFTLMSKLFQREERRSGAELQALFENSSEYLDSMNCISLLTAFLGGPATMTGKAADIIRFYEIFLSFLKDKEGVRVHSHPGLGFYAIAFAKLGETKTSTEILNRLSKDYDPAQGDIAARKLYLTAQLCLLYETREFNEERADSILNAYLSLLSAPVQLDLPMLKAVYVHNWYLRFNIYRAKPGREAMRKLLKNYRLLKQSSLGMGMANVNCHNWVADAQLSFVKGQLKRATLKADQAITVSLAEQNPWAEYEALLLKAEIAEVQHEPALSDHFRSRAIAIAQSQSWSGKLKDVPNNGIPGGRSTETASSRTATSLDYSRAKKNFSVLLAATSEAIHMSDPVEQAKRLLAKVTEVLGAERAFLFLLDDTQSMKLFASCTPDGDASNYSAKVLEFVRLKRQVMLITSSEEGQIIGSASIVAKGIRSIIAAPLEIEGVLKGVIYLDNRLARGVFESDDASLLIGLANQFILSLEMTKAARQEVEFREAKKDLEVTSAVQSLLLPRVSHVQRENYELVGYYKSAAQSGGDWWWTEEYPDGSFLVHLGDVTGHGAGSAMITSLIAGAYLALRDVTVRTSPETVSEILAKLDHQLHGLCDKKYLMTFTTVLVHPAEKRAHFWTLGGPLPLIKKPGGEIFGVGGPGTPLGYDKQLTRDVQTIEYQPGTRLILHSDGLCDLRRNETQSWGNGAIYRLFAASNGSALETHQRFLSKVEEYSAQFPAPDDISYVLIDLK